MKEESIDFSLKEGEIPVTAHPIMNE